MDGTNIVLNIIVLYAVCNVFDYAIFAGILEKIYKIDYLSRCIDSF